MCFWDRCLMEIWWNLVPISNQVKMILCHKVWHAQSRFLNNSPSVLKDFSLLGNTSILGFGSKNRVWNLTCERYEFLMDLGVIFIPKIIQNRPPNPFENEVGQELVSRAIFGQSCARMSRSDNTQNDIQGGGMREPKEGVTMSHALQAPFHGVGGYMYTYVCFFVYTLTAGTA